MKRQRFVVAVATFFLAPLLAFADGLVPCGGPGEPVCQTCYLVEEMSNVITWLVGVMSILFAIIFVYAGFRLATSAGNVEAKKTARGLVRNAFIGFVLLLAAWLLIDFLMKIVLAGDNSVIGNSPGPWNTIQCLAQPVPK